MMWGIIPVLLAAMFLANTASPNVAVNTCSFNDVAYVISGGFTTKTYNMPYAIEAWVGNAVTNVPEVYYTYYWDSNSKVLTVIFFGAGPDSGYVTYTVYFTTQVACPTEPPRGNEVRLRAYVAKVVDRIEPVSTKPQSIKSEERILPAYRAEVRPVG
ncbi:MAG: hypothetical protein ABWU84_01665 [Pyrobaculum sp.]|uniref:hypothetical protein n=1 Tax=Pyrobaculum sp. TaxID=2004705 RepID=UPI003EED621C